jgi:hypothetical protein
MEHKKILTILRNIHYKCFIIGVIFLIVATLIYMPCKCALAELYQNQFGIDTETYYNMWVSFVGAIKTIIIFFFLVPGLAIHWVEKCYKE